MGLKRIWCLLSLIGCCVEYLEVIYNMKIYFYVIEYEV